MKQPGVVVEVPKESGESKQKKMEDLISKDIILEKSVGVTKKWFENRTRLLNTALKDNKWVSIEGPTGCGKSTFINHNLIKDCKVFNGMEQLENWANDRSDDGKRYKTIFIDECNLTGKNFAMFRDLGNIPPTIVLNGKLITLTDKHGVIFASNPLSYGSGRVEPELVHDQAYKIGFYTIPPIVLYDEILKKLKHGKVSENQWRLISERWLNIYGKINSASQEPLITPRQLETRVSDKQN